MAVRTYRVVIEEDALADIAAIHAYTAASTPDTADEFIGRLLDPIDKLDLFPCGHQNRESSPRIPFPLWQVPFGSCRIICAILEEEKADRIMGVQHGGRATGRSDPIRRDSLSLDRPHIDDGGPTP